MSNENSSWYEGVPWLDCGDLEDGLNPCRAVQFYRVWPKTTADGAKDDNLTGAERLCC